MAITLTIDDNTRQWLDGSLLIDEPLNGQPRLSCDVFAASASWRPSLDDEVVVTQGSDTVFGGVIVQAREHGPAGALVARSTDIVTEITAVSFSILATYRYVTRAFTSGSLKDYAQILVDEYLDDDGVSLDAGMATGPTMPDRSYSAVRLDDVLNEWSSLTDFAWAWEITYDKKLRFFEIGTESAASITQANHKAIGDVAVEPKRGPYYNRVLLKAGENVIIDKADDFTGDGSTTTFSLTYPLVYQPQVGYGYVTNGATNYETLDLAGISSGATWEYDPATNSIERVVGGAPANGNAINITYTAQFPIIVIAEDAGEIAANGTREKIIAYPNVYDYDVALDLAESELSKGITIHREVTYTTAETGIRPGKTQTITFAARNINATCLVMQVRTRDVASKTLHRTVMAVEGSSTIQTAEREQVYRDWLTQGSGGGSVGLTPPVSSGGGSSSGSLVNLQRFTSTGAYTYTATPGTSYIIVELQGAGGGGSGIASPGGGLVSIGRSGGGGGWLRKKITADFDGATGSVGAGGSGGAAGNNAGSAGGDTTFTTTGAITYTAGGGAGGNTGGSGLSVFPNVSNGVGGGSASGGDDNKPGGGSFAGVVQSSTVANSGGGGYSMYGTGGYGSLVFAANSFEAAYNGTGKGGGGGSPVATGSASAQAGGNGSDGMVIIWEYR